MPSSSTFAAGRVPRVPHVLIPDLEEDRASLARLEEEWMSAMQARDFERLEQLVAPEFVFTAIHIDPDPMTREAWMGAAMGGYTISSFFYDVMNVVVAGETGIIHARYSQMASYDGRNLSSMFRLTDVWTRR